MACLITFAATAAGLAARPASASNPIDSKQAEAKRVLAQIQELDSRLERAVDAYNGAQAKLAGIEALAGLNRQHLKIARSNYKKAQALLAKRLVFLYTEGETSYVELLLGASSLSDFVDRVDASDRIAAQDARIVGEIISFRKDMRKRASELRRQEAEPRQLVAERAAHKAYIERRLHERERLVSSIKEEIAVLAAKERRRQRRLEAEARARIAASAKAASEPDNTQAGGTEPSREPSPATATASASDTASSPQASESPPPAKYGGVVAIAMEYLGVPYQWGGASPETGFDCSGFIMYVYAKVGVGLPHYAAAQYGYGVPVSKDELEPGDLVFFDGLGHNGIYIGAGQFIHAPHAGDVVKISGLSDPWYAATWVGARRLL